MVVRELWIVIPRLGIVVPRLGMVVRALGKVIPGLWIIIRRLGIVIPRIGITIPSPSWIVGGEGVIGRGGGEGRYLSRSASDKVGLVEFGWGRVEFGNFIQFVCGGRSIHLANFRCRIGLVGRAVGEGNLSHLRRAFARALLCAGRGCGLGREGRQGSCQCRYRGRTRSCWRFRRT